MSETPVLQPNINYHAALESREAALRQLLPVDYDYAQESGLLDLFYFDPETNEDGLLHTLSGNIKTGEDGAFVVEGFHHEPSGEMIWPTVADGEGEKAQPTTRAITDHLAHATSNERAKFRRFPLEPYRAQVAINGLKKLVVHADPETGKKKLTSAQSSMFPAEYDALAVMQAVRSAYDNHDPASEVVKRDDSGNETIIANGNAVLMDGKSIMPIRMVLDPKTRTILSAMPVIKSRPGVMRLEPEDVSGIMTYGLSKK